MPDSELSCCQGLGGELPQRRWDGVLRQLTECRTVFGSGIAVPLHFPFGHPKPSLPFTWQCVLTRGPGCVPH